MDKKKLRPTLGAQRVTWTVLQAAKGKTIADVEYGFTEAGPDCHQGEAIILHFSDGSSLRIDVGYNAVNLAEQFKGLKPIEVHTDLLASFAKQGPDLVLAAKKAAGGRTKQGE